MKLIVLLVVGFFIVGCVSRSPVVQSKSPSKILRTASGVAKPMPYPAGAK